MEHPLYSCMTKATTAEGDLMQHGPNWVVARRGTLKVFPDRLECGDWTIPYARVSDATLYSIRSNFVIPGYLLRVATDDTTYHFGLNAGSFWRSDLPFDVKREKGKLSYSAFSIAVRVAAVGALLYWIWERIARWPAG
jgi:hypothetical protein